MQQIQTEWLNNTACTDSLSSDSLGMDCFWGLYLITGSVSLVAITIFFSLLLWNYMREPNVKNNNSEVGDPSIGETLKRAMKSFMVYVDQKESPASSPERRVSEISQRNSPFSPANFTSNPSTIGTTPFRASRLCRRSFSVLDHEHVVDVHENTTARASSVSAPDHPTEEVPSNTLR